MLSPAEVEATVVPAMVERIAREFRPRRIILFGSYARGEAHQDSDVDLLVVLDEVGDRRETTSAIRRALRGMGAPKDVVVTTPDEIMRRGRLIGTVLEPALREGKVLYERDKVDSVSTGGIGEIAVSAEEREVQTRRWLGMARRDLRNAQTLVDAADPDPAAAAFHAQQAAEKAIKAALIWLGLEVPRTHDLDELRDLLPRDWETRASFPDLTRLATWAVQSRYPGPWPEPTTADARAAIDQARAIYRQVAADLASQGVRVDELG